MPILMPQLVTPDLEPGTETAPAFRNTAEWITAEGDVLGLVNCPEGIDIGRNRAGEDMPTPGWVEEDLVDGDGSTPVSVRAVPRTYLLPLILHKRDHAAWRALHRQVTRALSPFGPNGAPRLGVLRLWQPDGTWRELRCGYAGGAEGEGLNDRAGLWYRSYVIALRAFDPWWYSSAVTVSWRQASVGPFFPILPVALGSSTVLGSSTLDVDGDVATAGVWTITGPADGEATLRSETLGLELVLDLSGAHELAGGETVTVDMRRGHQAIRGPDGSSWWSARVGTPQMWPLIPGTNELSLTVTGATAATVVEMTYEPRHLTA